MPSSADLESLSQLLAGELTDARASELQRRLARDPELQALYATLQALPDDLADLPQLPPPPALDARVLAAHRPATRRSPRWIAGVAALAAAAAITVLWAWQAPPTLALAMGDTVVHGDARVVAGHVRIDVDGLARITMEPDPTLVRVPPAPNQEDPMKTAMAVLGGAVGGAVVTVAVLEGTATLRSTEGAPVELAAGEVRRVPSASARVAAPTPLTPLPGEDEAATIARLQGELETLRAALGQAQFTGAVTSGQLEAHVGSPQEWPDDVPEALTPDAMRAKAEQAAQEIDGVELVEVDCAEYPCIVVYESDNIEPGWSDRARPAAEALTEGIENAGLSVSASGFNNDGRTAGFLGVTVAPPDDAERGSDTQVRTAYRTSALLEELGQQATEGQASEEDVDVTGG
ncbi:MAG: hypothetical protein KTR31_17860 [Myxococcales bacterium]|nr:hypothetical protein [Myxococcales bacterium]